MTKVGGDAPQHYALRGIRYATGTFTAVRKIVSRWRSNIPGFRGFGTFTGVRAGRIEFASRPVRQSAEQGPCAGHFLCKETREARGWDIYKANETDK
jgi:hypothetical protein